MTWPLRHALPTYTPLFRMPPPPPPAPSLLPLEPRNFLSCDPQRRKRRGLSLSSLIHSFPLLTAPEQTHRAHSPLCCDTVGWEGGGADGLFFKLISKMYISSRSPSPDYLLIFNMKSSLYKQERQHKKLANLCINPLIEFPDPVVLHFLIKSISFFKGCCVICML